MARVMYSPEINVITIWRDLIHADSSDPVIPVEWDYHDIHHVEQLFNTDIDLAQLFKWTEIGEF